jgi:predicted DNA-binding protein (UPF0251 family)
MDHDVAKNDARSIKQDQLVALLLSGMSITDAAEKVGVHRLTATKWLRVEKVQQALATKKAIVEKSAYDIITEKYQKALGDSCKVVVEIMNETNPMVASAGARLKAVQMVQDRLAPIIAQPVEPSQEGQGVLVPQTLLPYLAPEELANIESYIALAEQRKVQAESDREVMERKRG